ncbi:unnamed protein product [Closterium sp. NIES-54]
MDAAKRVLRYLCSTSGMGLVLGGRDRPVLTGHSDASWADDQATQRSSQGYTFSLGSGSVSWRSTRSSFVLSSSCEAEIYATAMAAQELRWLTYLLTDLGEQPRSPPVLYVDNKATIALCEEHRMEHRTKHIALRYFLARELQQRGQLCLRYVATRASTADVFTKALQPSLLCFDWSCDPLFSPTLPMGSFGLSEANPVRTPLPTWFNVHAHAEEPLLRDELVQLYQSIVGSLMYASTTTQPQIAYAVSQLSKVVSCPKAFHLQAAKRVLRYLNGCVKSGIFYPAHSKPQVELVGFSDADYAGDSANRKSHTGYVYCLNGAAISWQSKRQPVVALSTTESEYISLCQCIQEGVWLKRLFGELGHEFAGGVPVFVDNQSAISLAQNACLHGRTKHMQVRWHFIREMVACGEVILRWCPTDRQAADILTKPLPFERHGVGPLRRPSTPRATLVAPYATRRPRAPPLWPRRPYLRPHRTHMRSPPPLPAAPPPFTCGPRRPYLRPRRPHLRSPPPLPAAHPPSLRPRHLLQRRPPPEPPGPPHLAEQPTAEPPCSSTAEPPSSRAAKPPSNRAAEPPSN